MPRFSIFPLFIIFLSGMIAEGQSAPHGSEQCLAALPPSVFKRVPVMVTATADDSAALAILPAADLLAQSLAMRMRTILGGNESELPMGDSVVRWRHSQAHLIVTARRDGSFSWARPSWAMPTDTGAGTAVSLTQRALGELKTEGEALIWPEAVKRDSLTFSIFVDHPMVEQDGRVKPMKVRVATAAFTLAVPWKKPVVVLKPPRIEFPRIPGSAGLTVSVRVTYVVDSTGAVDLRTLKDIRPAGGENLSADLRAYYRDFLQAVRRGLPTGKFAPAVIGGCPVSQDVIQPFDFKGIVRG